MADLVIDHASLAAASSKLTSTASTVGMTASEIDATIARAQSAISDTSVAQALGTARLACRASHVHLAKNLHDLAGHTTNTTTTFQATDAGLAGGAR